MSRNNDSGISLSSPPAIRVGPIVTPGSNETISIVIPLSQAQLTTVSTPKLEKSCKDYDGGDGKPGSTGGNSSSARNDKTKGCPFPSCTRYGRAFSRAHDLKRHIARHEMKKEKLADLGFQQIRPYAEYGGNFANLLAPQRDRQQKSNDDPREIVVESKILPCRHCGEKFGQENLLKAHLVSHEKPPEKSICTLCGFYLQSKEEAEEHMKQHTVSILQAHSVFEKFNVSSPPPPPPPPPPSSATEKESSTEKEDDFLLEEMLLLNKNQRCSTSGKSHGNGSAGKIRCDYCSKTFKTKWTLSSHVAAHEGRFQFDCGQCGKRFVRKSHYEGHVRSHEAARPFVCEQCGKTFKELKHRREHTKRKHPGLAANPMDGTTQDASSLGEKCTGPRSSAGKTPAEASAKDFPLERKDDFLLDMLLFKKNPRLDEASENGSNIRCDYCSKTFKTRWSLTSHVAAHEGRFRFDCGQCGKRFVRKSHYEGHVRSHEVARPYICEHCGKSFKELKHRREHVKKKHPMDNNQIANVLSNIDSCNPQKFAIADNATATATVTASATAVATTAAAAAAAAAAVIAGTCAKKSIPDQSKLSLSMPVNFNAYYS